MLALFVVILEIFTVKIESLNMISNSMAVVILT